MMLPADRKFVEVIIACVFKGDLKRKFLSMQMNGTVE